MDRSSYPAAPGGAEDRLVTAAAFRAAVDNAECIRYSKVPETLGLRMWAKRIEVRRGRHTLEHLAASAARWRRWRLGRRRAGAWWRLPP
jgi:hypothetical protein